MSSRRAFFFTGAAFLLGIAALPALGIARDDPEPTMPPPTEISVDGDVAKAGKWTTDRLSKELAAGIQEVHYTLHDGKPAVSHCVPLLALVQGAAPKVDPKRKNHLVAFSVVVRGADGYTAAFGMGELMPDLGNRAVWIALDRDGAPLSAKEAPGALVVPDDKKQARWVHSIARITVRENKSR